MLDELQRHWLLFAVLIGVPIVAVVLWRTGDRELGQRLLASWVLFLSLPVIAWWLAEVTWQLGFFP